MGPERCAGVTHAAEGKAVMQAHKDRVSVLASGSLVQTIEQLVHELPAKQRIALVQRKYYGLSYDEIAANLGISEDTARRNVQQAYRVLRNQLTSRHLM